MSLDTIKTLTDILGALAGSVQACATVLAFLLGGWWTYRLFVSQRQQYPRANLTHHIEHRVITKDKTLLHVTVTIANAGHILLQVVSGEVRVQQVLPLERGTLQAIKQGNDPVAAGQTEILWSLLGQRQTQWSRGQFEIEPGESDTFTCDFILDAEIESVSVYSYFKNEKKRERDIGWSATTLYDLKKKDEE